MPPNICEEYWNVFYALYFLLNKQLCGNVQYVSVWYYPTSNGRLNTVTLTTMKTWSEQRGVNIATQLTRVGSQLLYIIYTQGSE